MTLFFRKLGDWTLSPEAPVEGALQRHFADALYGPPKAATETALTVWLRSYGRRAVHAQVGERHRQSGMRGVNPARVPRNYLIQGCIEAAERGDDGPIQKLLAALRHPYDDSPTDDPLARRRPDWALASPACSTLSCSS